MRGFRASRFRTEVIVRALALLVVVVAISTVAQAAFEASWSKPLGSLRDLPENLLDPFTLTEMPLLAAGMPPEAMLMGGPKPKVRIPKRPKCRSSLRPPWVGGPPPWQPGGHIPGTGAWAW